MSFEFSFSTSGSAKGRPIRYQGSVLPTISGERAGGGFHLRNGGKTPRSLASTAAALLLFGCLGAAFLAQTLAEAAADGGFVPQLFVLFAFASVAFSLYRMYRSFSRDARAAANFGGADLHVQPWPLRLGDTFTLRFFRARRKMVDIKYVEAALECVEWFIVVDEDDREWRSIVRWRRNLADAPLPEKGQPLRFEWSSEIPLNEPATFSVGECAVEWRVAVKIHAAGEDDTDTFFPLLVLPVLRP